MGEGWLKHAHVVCHVTQRDGGFPLSIAQADRGVCDENDCHTITRLAEAFSDVFYKSLEGKSCARAATVETKTSTIYRHTTVGFKNKDGRTQY